MTKQHPHHERIVQLIERGEPDRAIYDRLKVSRKYIRAVRAGLGIAPYSRSKTVAEYLALYSSVPGPDGHVWWTGTRSTGGTPRIRINGREVPAAHSVFEQRAGQPAVGQVRPDCGMKHCVAPSHVMDDVERRKVRLQRRALLGYPDHWDECPACGADWASDGRVEEKLTLYCRKCTSARKARNRKGPDHD